MKEHNRISGRKFDNSGTWIWWVEPGNLDAQDSVTKARHALGILGELFEKRWEFKLMAGGLFSLYMCISLAFYGALSIFLGLDLLTVPALLMFTSVGVISSVFLVFGGLFIFPAETFGNWPIAVQEEDFESQ